MQSNELIRFVVQVFYKPTPTPMKTSVLLVIATLAIVCEKSFAQPTYCTTSLHGASSCSTPAGYIDSVNISATTLQNYGTTCNLGTAYTSYPAVGSTTASLLPSSTYTLHVFLSSVSMPLNNDISAWIDFNQNGVFETFEWLDLGRGVDSAGSKTFTVPSNAISGLTGMRIRNRYAGAGNDSTAACLNFSSGETEDYIVTIGSTTGERDFQEIENSFSLFPNPSNERINIQFRSSQSKDVVIKLVSMTGKVIYTLNESNFSGNFLRSIDVSNYSKGIYCLQLATNNGTVNKTLVIY